jgi:hypothetical protein
MGACSSKDGKTKPSIISNQAELSQLELDISRRLMSQTNYSTMNIRSSQDVTIREVGTPSNNPYYFRERSVKKGPFGIFGQATCTEFHCGYNVNQVGNYRIFNFNENIVNEVEDIYSDIENHFRQKANTALEGNPAGIRKAAKARKRSEEIIKEEMTSYLSNISRKNFGADQSILIEYQTPIRCINPCGINGRTHGPILNQHAQLTIYSKDIINMATEKIEEKYREEGFEVDQSLETTNDTCIMILMIMIISCICCLVLTWGLLNMAGEE